MTQKHTPLLPCPFCGGEPKFIQGIIGDHYVECKSCRASSYPHGKKEFDEIWNTRADNQLKERLEEAEKLIEKLILELDGKAYEKLFPSAQAFLSKAQDNTAEQSEANQQFEVILMNKDDNTIARRKIVDSLNEADKLADQFMRNVSSLQFHTQIWAIEVGSSAPPVLVDGEIGGDE